MSGRVLVGRQRRGEALTDEEHAILASYRLRERLRQGAIRRRRRQMRLEAAVAGATASASTKNSTISSLPLRTLNASGSAPSDSPSADPADAQTLAFQSMQPADQITMSPSSLFDSTFFSSFQDLELTPATSTFTVNYADYTLSCCSINVHDASDGEESDNDNSNFIDDD
ncbi:uncharacterized protein V1518DRAFT_428032 [Limtongia smithiae]|uniref:uncharacterized protein n=1 Tax=Limtongia smithiae TaxID=1125753 RepID=UPI0034CF5FCA